MFGKIVSRIAAVAFAPLTPLVKNENENKKFASPSVSRAYIFSQRTILLSWKNIVIGSIVFEKLLVHVIHEKKRRPPVSLSCSLQNRALVIRTGNTCHFFSTWQYTHRLSIPVSLLQLLFIKKISSLNDGTRLTKRASSFCRKYLSASRINSRARRILYLTNTN